MSEEVEAISTTIENNNNNNPVPSENIPEIVPQNTVESPKLENEVNDTTEGVTQIPNESIDKENSRLVKITKNIISILSEAMVKTGEESTMLYATFTDVLQKVVGLHELISEIGEPENSDIVILKENIITSLDKLELRYKMIDQLDRALGHYEHAIEILSDLIKDCEKQFKRNVSKIKLTLPLTPAGVLKRKERIEELVSVVQKACGLYDEFKRLEDHLKTLLKSNDADEMPSSSAPVIVDSSITSVASAFSSIKISTDVTSEVTKEPSIIQNESQTPVILNNNNNNKLLITTNEKKVVNPIIINDDNNNDNNNKTENISVSPTIEGKKEEIIEKKDDKEFNDKNEIHSVKSPNTEPIFGFGSLTSVPNDDKKESEISTVSTTVTMNESIQMKPDLGKENVGDLINEALGLEKEPIVVTAKEPEITNIKASTSNFLRKTRGFVLGEDSDDCDDEEDDD